MFPLWNGWSHGKKLSSGLQILQTGKPFSKWPNPPRPQFTRQTEIQALIQPVTIIETPSTTQIVDVAKEVEEAMKKTNPDF